MKAIKLLTLVLLFTAGQRLYSSVLIKGNDSLRIPSKTQTTKEVDQYSISIAANSDNLKWTVIRKWYYKNSDTTLVFNQQSRQLPVLMLNKMTEFRFMNEDHLLAFGNGNAEFYDLRSKAKKTYENVLQVSTLKIGEKHVLYAILQKDGRLQVCGTEGKVIYQISGVKSLQTIDHTGFIVDYSEFGKGELIKINPFGIKNLYTSERKIRRVVFSSDKQYAVIDEELQNVSDLKTVNLKTGKISELRIDTWVKDYDEVEMSPIGSNGSYLIQLRKHIKPDNELLEIWYGNESDIRSVYSGKSAKTFLIWDSTSDTIKKLPSESGEIFVAFTNSKYLLKYHPNRGHNYIRSTPTIELKLYDIAKSSEMSMGKFAGVNWGAPEIIYNESGQFILGSEDHKHWNLWELENRSKVAIGGEELKKPFYTKDGKSIYFDSKNGLWRYDIKLRKLLPLVKVNNTLETTILNGSIDRQFNEYYFGCHMTDSSQSLLYKNYDFVNNETDYSLLRRGKVKQIIPQNANRIKDVNWDHSLKEINYLEENHNFPTTLFFQKGNSDKRKIFQSNPNDHLAFSLQAEVIRYKNKAGKDLQGTLYYPAYFNKNEKYPMVVKIYQIQRYRTNEYMIKGNASYVAYDKRGLIEREYFVFEPDIVYGNEGTGYGALDCVNRAMDALQNYSNIDFSKVALIGHSHGGYSTNFIATHSNRFATYISGAGNSDIVRSYFSYNRNFHTPFYFQFESGQYEMPPFAENKDLYFKNNPIHYVEQVNAPILLWAGKKDENIFWEQVQEFYIGLKRNSKDVVALFYGQGNHALGIENHEKEDMRRRATQWLDYFLKNKKDVEWINKQMIKSP